MADPEFEPLRAAFPQLNTCGADEHEPQIKRFIRTVKDHVRSVYHSLPYRYIPRLLLVHLVKAAVFWLNAFPHHDGISDQSPRYIMTGHTLNFQCHWNLVLMSRCTRSMTTRCGHEPWELYVLVPLVTSKEVIGF